MSYDENDDHILIKHIKDKGWIKFEVTYSRYSGLSSGWWLEMSSTYNTKHWESHKPLRNKFLGCTIKDAISTINYYDFPINKSKMNYKKDYLVTLDLKKFKVKTIDISRCLIECFLIERFKVIKRHKEYTYIFPQNNLLIDDFINVLNNKLEFIIYSDKLIKKGFFKTKNNNINVILNVVDFISNEIKITDIYKVVKENTSLTLLYFQPMTINATIPNNKKGDYSEVFDEISKLQKILTNFCNKKIDNKIYRNVPFLDVKFEKH